MKIFGGPEYVHDIVGFLSIGAYAWGKLFDRSQFDGISFPIGRLWEDVFTIPYILYRCKKIIFLDEPLCFYRIRSDSIMSSGIKLNRIDEVLSYFELYEFAVQNKDAILMWGSIRWALRAWKGLKAGYNQAKMDFPEEYHKYDEIISEYRLKVWLLVFNPKVFMFCWKNIFCRWDY